MHTTPGRVLTQPVVGILIGATGLAILTAAWTGGALAGPLTWSPTSLLLAVALVASVALAYQFPILVGYNRKIQMTSVPLYLSVVLLPPLLAVTTIALALLAGNLMVRGRRGLFPSDIATDVGRWTVMGMGVSLVIAYFPVVSGLHVVGLVVAAALLWAADILTAPLVIAPMSGESAPTILRAAVRDAGAPEAAQYLLGILGAITAATEPLALIILILPTGLVYKAFKNAKEMRDSTERLLEQMADTVDLRDAYTGGHSRRVTALSRNILREMDLEDTATAKMIIAAARVHDIGKIAIPDFVLNKPGPLTPEERRIMETHPERGADLLLQYPDFALGVDVVRHHHERWDGGGYPHHLRGNEIPFGARLIAVADGFDAMTSDRPYRAAMSVKSAADVLRAGRGTQWDPLVVDAFLRTIASDLEETSAPRLRLVAPVHIGEHETRVREA